MQKHLTHQEGVMVHYFLCMFPSLIKVSNKQEKNKEEEDEEK